MFVSRSSRAIAYISSRSSQSAWLHVVPRAGQDNASIWVGTLDGTYPSDVKVSVYDETGNTIMDNAQFDGGWVRILGEEAMKDPSLVDQDVVEQANKDTDDGYCSLSAGMIESQPYTNSIELSDLSPGTKYKVKVRARGLGNPDKKIKVKASFKTLPNALNDSDPFTVFMGSCYYAFLDDDRVASAYKRLHRNADYPTPDLNLFMGDQVYLDIPFLEHVDVEKADEMREHMTASYRDNWKGLHSVFKRANNMFTSDDHEFYNNYPFHPLHILRLGNPFGWEKAERRWSAIAKSLYRGIQAPMERDQYQFDIGNDLSFMKVDIRVNRKTDGEHFMPTKHLEKLKKWIKNLKTPGVLVLGQPLMIHETTFSRFEDKILSNYDKQYGEMITALSQSPHDIVLLSGDVHFGRIAHVQLDSGATLHEVIASPMALIERKRDDGTREIDPNESKGLATVSEPAGPYTYPNDVDGVSAHEVIYERFVRSKADNTDEPDDKRTEEHFKTVSFTKSPGSNKVNMEVRAWLPRLKVTPAMAADNEVSEEDWSSESTNSGLSSGPYTVRLK